MSLTRRLVLGAALLGLATSGAACGRDSDDSVPAELAPTSELVEGRPTNREIVRDVQSYWAEEFPKVADGAAFKPVPSDRIVALGPGRRSTAECDGDKVRYGDVEDNAFATECSEGPIVVWDEDRMMRDLDDQFGPVGPAIVLAHEFGHIIQFQEGADDLSSIIAEQQSDCYAGAWFGARRDRYAVLATPAALTSAVAASVAFSDAPGDSPDDFAAHGSGFDRVRAFQEGFDRGVEHCHDYAKNAPPLVQLPFSSSEEELSGGNLEFDEALDTFLDSLNAYAQQLVGSFPEITKAVAADDYSGRCDGRTVSVRQRFGDLAVVCRRQRVLVYDSAALRADHDGGGDGATGTVVAMAWAEALREQAGERPFQGSGRAQLQRACLVGGWFRQLLQNAGVESLGTPGADDVNADDSTQGDDADDSTQGDDADDSTQGDLLAGGLAFSPGDLDESITMLIKLSDDDALGDATLFEVVAALRQGVTEGPSTCDLGR